MNLDPIVCLLRPFSLRSQTESLIYAISTRIEEDDVTTKAESGGGQTKTSSSSFLSLSLSDESNPLAGKSK